MKHPAAGPCDVSPNLRVLAAVVRRIAAGDASALEAALHHVTDRDALVDLALEVRLVPQLSAALREEASSWWVEAEGPTSRLATLTQDIAVRSLRMTRGLLSVIALLRESGIPVLALKGPAVSRLAYGDESMRHSVDLDVLVRPEDVLAARVVLEAAGYVSESSWGDVPWETVKAAEHMLAVTAPGTGIPIEIHWRIGPRFAPDSLLAEELFARAGSVLLLGRPTPTLGRADSVLALVVHAGTHEWSRLEDIATLCAILRGFDYHDWRVLADAAAQHACRRRLAIGLRIAVDIGGVHISPLQSRLVQYPGAKRLAREVERRLLLSPRYGSTSVDDCQRPGPSPAGAQSAMLQARVVGILWQARALDTWQATVRHLWQRLFASGARDWASAANAGPRLLPEPLAQIYRRQVRLWKR